MFVIVAAIGGGIQKLLKKPQDKIKDIVKIAGGLVFGIIALVIKLTEITFRGISNLLGTGIVWVVLALLLGAGIFATIGMIAKKDTRTAKWVGTSGIVYGILALFCGIIFSTLVPEQNRNVITNII